MVVIGHDAVGAAVGENVGGMDGEGKMAWDRVYRWVLLPRLSEQEVFEKTIDAKICRQYEETQRELADQKHGHISNRHPDIHGEGERAEYRPALKKGSRPVLGKIKTALKENKTLRKNQLIYVETDSDNDNRIVSFGHHYYYRWRYADSVRQIQAGRSGIREPRPQLVKLADERLGEDGGKLSGVRSLLGYVADKDYGTQDIGDDDYGRYAGRVSINTAIEQIADGMTPDQRFVAWVDADKDDGTGRFNLPLKLLGQPKSSADMFYLDQSGVTGRFNTYGELPGVEESGVELAGRKFYPHQRVDAARNTPFATGKLDVKDLASKQATLARFISSPGARFRFTLRYRDLRDWELGAVMLALCPDLIRETGDNLMPEVEHTDEPVHFAQKLGYGKPLGLGSVDIRIKEHAQWTENDGENLPELTECSESVSDFVEQFVKMARERGFPLNDWLMVTNWADGGKVARGHPPLDWFGKKRKEQIRNRRKR